MPRDNNEKEKVERWKLSPQLLEIERAYRNRARLSKILQEGIKVKTGELDTMAKALYRSEQEQEMLSKMIPSDRMEIEGTPMPEQENIPDGIDAFQINY